ncbi:MAG: hypothetical protein H6746_09785 [Deltaproteobacteria bacterium]|nr:hypothetical protein [Deltaproteobacteria bacterium]
MEPTIEPVEVGLLTRHAQLPSSDAVLSRFAAYYRETLERVRSGAAADELEAARAAGEAVADAASFESLAAEAAHSGMMASEAPEPAAWEVEEVDETLATSHDLPALSAEEPPLWEDEAADSDDAPTREAPFAAAPGHFFVEEEAETLPEVDEAAVAAAWGAEPAAEEGLIQGDFFEDGEGPGDDAFAAPEEPTRAMAAMPEADDATAMLQAMPDDEDEATSMLQAMPDDEEEATSMLQAMPDDEDGATTMMQAMPDDGVDAVSVEALPGGDDEEDSGPETQRSPRKTRKRSRKSKTVK